jgi:nucleotide-binding universal stress UspA family protein
MSAILTCTDGSPYAASVYQSAAWAAKRLDLPVRVLHMVEASVHSAAADFSGSLGFDAGDELLEELAKLGETSGRLARLKSNAILKDAETRFAEFGIPSIESIQRHGSIVEALGDYEPPGGLVVIGKRGEHADLAKGHLGSNLERVIRAATLPVLIASRAFTPIERVLVAFDGGISALKAITTMATSPLFKGCKCHLVAVTKPDSETAVAVKSAEVTLKGAGLEATSDVVEGRVEDVIANQVRDLDSQLLVMGAYGHSRIRHLIIGSTTTELIRTCQIPVLVIR